MPAVVASKLYICTSGEPPTAVARMYFPLLSRRSDETPVPLV